MCERKKQGHVSKKDRNGKFRLLRSQPNQLDGSLPQSELGWDLAGGMLIGCLGTMVTVAMAA